MTMTRFERFLPLGGVLGGLLWAIAVILTINEPQATDNATKYAPWFADHEIQGTLAAVAAGYVCVLMLGFAAAVRRALRPAGTAYAGAAFAGPRLPTGRSAHLCRWQAIAVVQGLSLSPCDPPRAALLSRA